MHRLAQGHAAVVANMAAQARDGRARPREGHFASDDTDQHRSRGHLTQRRCFSGQRGLEAPARRARFQHHGGLVARSVPR